MARVDTSQYQTFPQITERLDAIVSAVRDKDVSLERSLDLFDEAIALGSKAVDMVDATDFTPEEAAQLEDEAAKKAADSEDVSDEGSDADGELADDGAAEDDEATGEARENA